MDLRVIWRTRDALLDFSLNISLQNSRMYLTNRFSTYINTNKNNSSINQNFKITYTLAVFTGNVGESFCAI